MGRLRHRRAAVFAKIHEIVVECGATTLLDFGAGDGYFLMNYLPRNVSQAYYFDIAGRVRRSAESELRSLQKLVIVRDRAELLALQCDVIVFSSVWMEIRQNEEILQCLSDMKNALTPNGRILAAVSHPCFREEKFKYFHTSFDNSGYKENGLGFVASVRDDFFSGDFQDYHWNLEGMFEQICVSGLLVTRVFEVGEDSYEDMTRGAPWLVLELRQSSF